MPDRVLKPEDWTDNRPYRPQTGFSRHAPRASLDMSARRMLGLVSLQFHINVCLCFNDHFILTVFFIPVST